MHKHGCSFTCFGFIFEEPLQAMSLRQLTYVIRNLSYATRETGNLTQR